MSASGIRFHVAARAEAEASIRWYDERVGLGNDFLTEVVLPRSRNTRPDGPSIRAIRARGES